MFLRLTIREVQFLKHFGLVFEAPFLQLLVAKNYQFRMVKQHLLIAFSLTLCCVETSLNVSNDSLRQSAQIIVQRVATY